VKPKEQLFSALPIPEQDKYETTEDLVEKRTKEYECAELLSLIGTKKFKFTYLNFIPDIKKYSLTLQRKFCEDILDKIKEEYSFDFFRTVDFDTEDEIFSLYEFLEYLEFLYVDFFSLVFREVRKDAIRAKQLEQEVLFNSNVEILQAVDRLAPTADLPKLYKVFLLSQDRTIFIENFYKMTKKYSSEILLSVSLLDFN
jgi:hypothetical protein